MPDKPILLFCERGYHNILKAFFNCFGHLHNSVIVKEVANLLGTQSRYSNAKGTGLSMDLFEV